MRDRRIEARTWLEVRDIYSGHSPPPLRGGGFLSKLKNREEIGKEKGGKEEKKTKE